MIVPRGFIYWFIDKISGNYRIVFNAPEWAKDEFVRYQNLMNEKGIDY